MTRPRVEFIILFIAVCLLFLLKAFIQLDPDLGWYMRMGEIISKEGMPRADPFSYTMASYPYVDQEWFANIGVYFINSIFGYGGLAILHTIFLVICTLIIFRKNIFSGEYNFGLSLLFLATFLPYFGVRHQVQSWLYLAILLWLIKDKVFEKYYWFIPLLSLWWANVHGSFPVLIVVLSIDFLYKTYEKKRILAKRSLVLLLSIFTTFLTPHFYHAWRDVYAQITDTSLRWRIQEWYPSIMQFSIPYVFYISLYFLALKTYWHSMQKTQVLVSLFFFIQALLSTRHVPLWVISSTPLIIEGFRKLEKQVEKIKQGRQRFRTMGKAFLSLCILVFTVQISLSMWGARSSSEDIFYPKTAIKYLANNTNGSRIFSLYGWGGYLIWKLPQEKVYIDGRMPSWRNKNAPENETGDAMKDYLEISEGKRDFNNEADKYNIGYVLLPIEKKSENFLVKIIGNLPRVRSQEFSSYSYLSGNGWEKVYEDKVAVIYRRGLDL